MNTFKSSLAFIICLLFSVQSVQAQKRYGETLCNLPEYFCMKIKNGDTWDRLFPNIEEQDIVRRINRMNIRLKPGMIIAVPKNIERLTIYDVSPFPRYIEPSGEKTIYVSQKKLAWGAYDEDGELLWWGPISSGVGKCKVIGGCSTPTGSFRIIRKQDIDCVSTVFPRRANGEHGGALMPYCMHFFRGYALHGSYEVPGYRASHGCVRMFIEDARWLNEEFIDLPGGGMRGTRVILDAPDTQDNPDNLQ
ncbi:TPA: L,D-transpeptidase [Legionella pneumophila]|uniref:L,D-transpeptidase n=1 Tax=Legionella pneumophila TaxID=446 RepID=UPI000786C92F|nr:L,D-transpeptidase [Legionella pneumophila]MDW8880233.1 L,D-transpeptidase [Legionella pneumophila subsp. fraseri]MDW8963205.1 L,D-transpeptidase [Legionella pneumophila subsp. fraseri]MDW9036842.1 L,D-transpeptidase [Legionella pneumophila subsp. fraseri]MDW9040046.1 L,D-transpeptidase [Legionella pneumophila subsp. fraseri]MDW9043036.1 L,D-transpeptidase [Legionella pneumophila subsp. fraseri]